MREQEKQTGKKVRKDAVALVEFVLTFSPEMEEGLDFNRWHEANLKWLEKEFGEGKIIRFDTNHDEATKHGHYFVLPTDERGYLNASRYFGKKKQIIALQDSYAEAMEVFGLERGRSKEETGANHQSLNEWHKQEEERLLAEIVCWLLTWCARLRVSPWRTTCRTVSLPMIGQYPRNLVS